MGKCRLQVPFATKQIFACHKHLDLAGVKLHIDTRTLLSY